ncbi:MAG: alginate lyase family protein [Sneathiellaceae bacterium]
MSPAEILHRLQEQERRMLSRLLPAPPGRFLRPGAEDRLPDLPVLRRRLPVLAEQTGLAATLAEAAACVGRGEIAIYGRAWSCRTAGAAGAMPLPDWHWDPGSGGHWPEDRYCFDIPFRHVRLAEEDAAAGSAAGEARFVWELNRLAYLQPVAAHACLSGDDRARQVCIAHLSDWLDRNPPYTGINWASGIELGTRLVSIVVILAFLEPASLPSPLRRRLAESLAAHGHWLHRFPSRHSSANNHVIAELAGLFLLGSLFDGLRHGPSWAEAARAGLQVEAQRQIFDDGTGAETSPAYAALNLELFGICAQVAAETRNPFPDPFLRRLASGAAWLRAIGDASGRVADIGDADGASLFFREGPQALYPAAIRGCIAQLTGRHELAPAQVQPGLRHALFGLPAPGVAPADGVTTFPDGGLTVMRWSPDRAPDRAPDPASGAGSGGAREAVLLFDHGPLGYLSIAAHGHADALAVWLHLDGHPVLVDAGTWLYLGAGDWRSHFRSTAAHNTLAVGGADSSQASGPFNWRTQAQAALLEVQEAGASWHATAEHDGYVAATGYRHRRTVRRAGTRQIVIEDVLVGGRAGPKAEAAIAVPVEIGFLFAADLDVSAHGEGWQAARAGQAVLHVSGAEGMAGNVVRGAKTPPEGWVSPAFGERRPASRLSFRGAMRHGGTCRITLTIE